MRVTRQKHHPRAVWESTDTPDTPYRLTIDTLKRMQNDLLMHTASKNEYLGDPA